MSSRRRRRTRSPAVTPLDDDDLLCEILLRLPPQPSSLPRAFAVCNRWRRLVSDPGFSRRFRVRHRRNPPLLGFFDKDLVHPFLPALEAPNRVPPERFSLPSDSGDGGRFRSLGCRHGLLLIFLEKRLQVLVWDPITGDKHHIAVPAPFDTMYIQLNGINGAVHRDALDVQHFQVVLASVDGKGEQQRRAFACIYSSKTGLWGNLISTQIPSKTTICSGDAVLAGDSLYWLLAGNFTGFLEFDLVKQSLAVIPVPVDLGKFIRMMRAEGGGFGCFVMSESKSDYTAQLWKRMTDCDGVSSWGLARTIELGKPLSLDSEEKRHLFILGFAEENNVVLLWTMIGIFMINLESLKFKKLLGAMRISAYQPFESVYTTGVCVDGRHDGAEPLVNT